MTNLVNDIVVRNSYLDLSYTLEVDECTSPRIDDAKLSSGYW